MDDPFSASKPFTLANYHMNRMVLSPEHWASFPSHHRLGWTLTKFEKSNAANIPADQNGVYSFLVVPGIAAHTGCSYLMYIGKAERQSLRTRFNQYFEHITETSRWVHISKMLRLWQDHLWFCYAPVADSTKIDATEQDLLNAFLPPFNHRYKGVVAKQLKVLFA